MTVTKEHLIRTIYDQGGLSWSQSTRVIESLLENMKSALEDGEHVLISGFGKFEVKEKRGRLARNLQTKEPLMLEPRRVVTFKCSGMLRDKLNRK